MSASTPSPRWTALLRLLPRRDREHLVDELAALYRMRLQRWGKAATDAWYRREVVALLLAAPVEAGRRRWRSRRHSWIDTPATLSRMVVRALRSYRSQPGFGLLAVVTLALGIGASIVIFSIVDQVVIRPLPYPEPDRLVAIWPNVGLLRGELAVIEEEATMLDGVGGWVELDGLNLERSDGSRRVSALMASPRLLPTLGVEVARGRGFAAQESRPGRDRVALLSWGFWADEFGADPGIVGREIRLDENARTVVGVLPAGFDFPAPRDVWVPLPMDPEDAGAYWGWGGHRAVGRLAAGASPGSARDELLALSERTRELNTLWTPAEGFRATATVVPLRDHIVGDVAGTLWLLMGAVFLVLLVACANVANLLLARGLSRRRELAVRSALGAGRGRIVAEQLVEAMLLAVMGCVVGLLGARWALAMMLTYLPPDVPRATEIVLDGRVALGGVLMALIAGAVAGVFPALRGARVDPGVALREGGRGSGGATARRRLSGAMVVMQVATAVVLVIGAGLLLRSLGQLGAVEAGFSTEGVITARLTVGGERYDDESRLLTFYDGVLTRLRGMPAVSAVAAATHVPFGSSAGFMATNIEGVTEDPNSLPVTRRVQATEGYLEALRIPLLEGRTISANDTPASTLVAVVDQAMAEAFWPGESPLGRRIKYPWAGAPWLEVVGVVGSVADGDLGAPRDPTFYVPLSQAPSGEVNLVLRTDVPTAATATAIREAAGELDRLVPVSAVVPLQRLIWGSMASPRWTALVLTTFAVVALLLGSIGIYGVIAYSVRGRSREIGVRMALGAAPSRVRGLVLGEGLVLGLLGIAVGVPVAALGAQALTGLLFGISTLDPITFLSIPALMAAVAVAAAYLPARRATRVDPVEAIRSD